MDDALHGLPPTAAAIAGDSIQTAMAVAMRQGGGGAPLADAAGRGFVSSMHPSATVVALAMLAGAALPHRHLPARAADAVGDSAPPASGSVAA